jgi:hypothetical protein
MKRLLFSACLALLTVAAALAQRGSLNGRVVDKATAEHVSFATVALMKAGEENALTGTVSDETGRFLIDKVPYGTYQLLISFIGYQSVNIPDVTLSAADRELDLGTIALELDAIGIEEVEVKAAARTTVNKIDRRTYRAEDFETARGGSAIDVLSKLPSVSIGSENDILVRGSSDFVVYLNGKPTSTSASLLLGQIPSENIENIDIIPFPPPASMPRGKGGLSISPPNGP